MERKRVWPIIIQILFLILILGTFGFKIYDNMTKYRETQLPHSSYVLDEWTWVHEDGTEEQVILPCKLPVKSGEAVTLRAEVPYVTREGYRLAFFNSRQCKVYVGRQCRYDFSPEQANIVGGIVKGIWSFTKLNYSDFGKDIVIVRDDPNAYNGEFSELYYGDSLGIIYNYLRKYAVFYFFVILLVGLAIVAIPICTFLRISLRHRVPLTDLCVGLLLCALWMVYDSELFQLTFDNFYIDGVIGYMMILLMPVPILMYINDMQKNRHEKMFHALMMLSLVASIVFYVMHFMEIRNFEKNLLPILGLFCLLAVCALVTIVTDIRKGFFREYRSMAVGMAVFVAFTIAEVASLYFIATYEKGVFLLVGLYALFIAGVIQQLIEIYESDRASRQAQEASKQKSTFLANMSHEIRTPINSIIGMNEMILRECKDSEIREYSLQVESSGKLLLGLVNDVLDFSKIEAGKMDIITAAYDVGKTINDIEIMLSERASSKNLKTVFNIAEDIPRELIGDEIHIKQILINLISNAVKYTNEGTVTFTMKSSPSIIDNRADIKFIVSDTGMGIRKESRDKLFDTFTRADEQRNKSIEGTGLGLSIVKSLVEVMGGTIDVESEYGVGSTFTVVIPQEISDATPIGNLAEALEKEDGRNSVYVEKFRAPEAEILIVDDNAVNLKVAAELLKATKVKIDTASGGRECVYKCRDKHYDLILMDHRMPDPDGVATLHLLKDDFDGLNKETNVVVLTANAFTGLREKYIAEGFVDYLSKPIDSTLLEETVMKYLPQELVITGFTEEASASENGKNQKAGNFAAAMREIKDMDYDRTLDKYSGSEEFMKTLLRKIADDGLKKIDLMEKHLEDKNYVKFGIEAHAVRSTMATIFATGISEHAKNHEIAVKEGRTEYADSDGKAFLNEYRNLLNRINEALE